MLGQRPGLEKPDPSFRDRRGTSQRHTQPAQRIGREYRQGRVGAVTHAGLQTQFRLCPQGDCNRAENGRRRNHQKHSQQEHQTGESDQTDLGHAPLQTGQAQRMASLVPTGHLIESRPIKTGCLRGPEYGRPDNTPKEEHLTHVPRHGTEGPIEHRSRSRCGQTHY